MTYNDCCLRALKHGFSYCPDCGQMFTQYEPNKKTALVLKKQKSR